MAKRLIIILITFLLLLIGVIYLVLTRCDKRFWGVRNAAKFRSIQAALNDLPDFWEVRNAAKFRSIQAALDDLPDSGGIVFIPPGTHTITSTIIMKSNQALVGAGSSSIITTATPDINLIDIVGTDKYPNDYRNIYLQNFHLKNINSGTGNGIRLRRCHEVFIENLFIEKCLYGIYFENDGTYDADNNVISHCNFYSNFGAGIGCKSDGSEWACEENIIESCQFRNDKCGIFYRGRKSTIRGNCIEEETEYGIQLYEGDHVIVNGNTIGQCDKHGILVNSGNSHIISNNIIIDCDYENQELYSGIRLDTDSNRNTLIGNVCYNNDRYEIVIQNSDCDKNVLVGNICYGSDHKGAIVDNGTGTISQNNLED